MRFITCVDIGKLKEVIDSSYLDNNMLFDFNNDSFSQSGTLLEELNGEFTSLNVGVYVPDNYGDLSSIWSQISKIIPVKAGDAIIQFNLDEDECIYFDFNNILDYLYNGDSELSSIVSYEPKTMGIVLSDRIPANKFDCAFLVNSEWGRENLSNSNNGLLITTIMDLNVSEVWRS